VHAYEIGLLLDLIGTLEGKIGELDGKIEAHLAGLPGVPPEGLCRHCGTKVIETPAPQNAGDHDHPHCGSGG
jgi:hypothetical protein